MRYDRKEWCATLENRIRLLGVPEQPHCLVVFVERYMHIVDGVVIRRDALVRSYGRAVDGKGFPEASFRIIGANRSEQRLDEDENVVFAVIGKRGARIARVIFRIFVGKAPFVQINIIMPCSRTPYRYQGPG
ncbi:MAG: hypothetical protein BWY17_05360 [Deltaproteobacteria bacterium ADurb.Bin207]|nr:MAG: hypothetical protein BWY17_05360 [Deltaproteobacteria bacterium ADurb.Bin207]